MTTIEVELNSGETDVEDPKVAHYVRKRDHMDGFIFGTKIQALCGIWFVPTRDPAGFPLCEGCTAKLREIVAPDG